MKNKDLFVLHQGILSCKDLKGKAVNAVKFTYCCSKNKGKLESELKHIQGTIEIDEVWAKFNREKDALLQKFATLDDNGKPIRKQINEMAYEYEMTEEQKTALQVELDTFIKENESVIKDREEKIKKYQELLEEESTLDIHTVALENIPDDISQEQMDAIMPMVESEVIIKK